jgi:hypothetical protein
MPLDVLDNDVIQTVDRIGISATMPLSLTFVETRTVPLTLSEWLNDGGHIQLNADVITWHIPEAMNKVPYALTQTFKVEPGAWSMGSLTKVIRAQDPALWLGEREVALSHRYPRIVVNPAAITVALTAEMTTTRRFTISNRGSADLQWNLREHPDVPWLILGAENTAYLPGLTAPADDDAVTLTLDAALIPEAFSSTYTTTVYTSMLTLTTNDPLSATVNLPVTLTVTRPTYAFLPVVLRR